MIKTNQFSKWFIINRNDKFEFKTSKFRGMTVNEVHEKWGDQFIEFLEDVLTHPDCLEIDRRNIRDIIKELK